MTENWFPIQIFKTKINGVDQTLKNVLPILENLWAQPDALIPPWISTGGTYSTYPRNEKMNPVGRLLHTVPELEDAIEQIEKHVQEYWQILQLDPEIKPVIEEMWCQRYVEGVGDKHKHPEFFISGGLYLHASGVQTITFENPIADLYDAPLLSAFDSAVLSKTVLLEQGDLILWPGWMNHTITAVKPADYVSGATRITLPVMIRGEYGAV